MDVRAGNLAVARSPYGSHLISLADRGALGDRGGPEVNERGRIAVRRLDRDAASVGRERAREGDCSRGRRDDGRAGGGADVDAPVLPALVRVRAEVEGLQYRPIHGPGPGERGRHADLEREQGR